MPISDQSNQSWVVETLQKLDLKSMLDVGAGAGTYAHIFAQHFPNTKRFAVEAWAPYIQEFALKDIYVEVFNHDIRDHEYFNYDIIIFGDVLEHMTKEEALSVWDKVSKQSSYALISIPIVHYPQDAVHGNPFEEHIKDDWSHEEVLATFPQITNFTTSAIVGSYLACF
jgi:cyclopropane fatty-acyl-phospholipid synthase-like methyltransferase